MGKTQKELVLDYLIEHDGITQKEASRHLGVSRLAAIVYFLRQDGHPISSETVKVKNRWGGDCFVSRYTLGNK